MCHGQRGGMISARPETYLPLRDNAPCTKTGESGHRPFSRQVTQSRPLCPKAGTYCDNAIPWIRYRYWSRLAHLLPANTVRSTVTLI